MKNQGTSDYLLTLIDVYRYIIGAAGCITIIGLIIFISDKIKKAESVALWGQESLQIYILQSFALTWIWPMIWERIVEKLKYNPLIQNTIVYWGITAVLAIAILLVLSKIATVMKRIPKVNKFLFGGR